MATTGGRGAGEHTPAGVSVFWQIVVVLMGLFVLSQITDSLWTLSTGYPGWGDIRTQTSLAFDPDANNFYRVTSLKSGDPLVMAGVQEGDAIRLDQSDDIIRKHRVGQTIGFTLRHDGTLSHRVATAVPSPTHSPAVARRFVFSLGVMLLTLIIGLLVTVRSRRQASTLLLGAALISLSAAGNLPTLSESTPWFFPVFYAVSSALLFAPPVLLLAFARAIRRETSGQAPRHWAITFYVFTAIQMALWACDTWSTLSGGRLLLDEVLAYFASEVALLFVGHLLAVVALAAAWRESRGLDRTRYAFMLVAISLLSCEVVVWYLAEIVYPDPSLANPLVLIEIVCTITGTGVFTYAVLRHRVVDIGFAVSRTLVYGVVSATLLATFGLVEWAVDHFVPVGGREKNVLVDAAVAVGVFLAFHRVRDWVEDVIESLFFSHWKKAEADLRRFVKEASFITQTSSLVPAFAQALRHYTGGAEAAVYVAEGHRYTRAAGEIASAPADLDVNLPALVSVRAAQIPIEMQHGALVGCLVAPMINRNETIGMAIVGPKPSARDLRPDEIELIGWATRQVGLDMHALKIEQLDGQIATLLTEVTTLRSLVKQLA